MPERQRHAEVAEDQNEDEDVVDAERLLDEEAGEELERRLAATLVSEENREVEEQREGDQIPNQPRALRRPGA
ncbi:MAG TPA: hypothetical protein VFT98_08500 [Myxococcota bacterium]|nr:hypothetical protein [Myxococcota bacterium]